MTKAQMEDDQAKYHILVDEAKSAIQQGLHREAVERAMSSWKHIDGMMQYERKYENVDFDSVEGIDIVLEHAPLLFDFRSLDALEAFLKDERRIERNTSEDLGAKLGSAREIMWDARRMWDCLEQHGAVTQDELFAALGGDAEQWRLIAEAWEEMKLVRRTPEGSSYRLAFVTRIHDVVLGKCPSCGVMAKAPKLKFLAELACPKCRASVLFAILLRTQGPSAKE